MVRGDLECSDEPDNHLFFFPLLADVFSLPVIKTPPFFIFCLRGEFRQRFFRLAYCYFQ